jgi:hypothetical protein
MKPGEIQFKGALRRDSAHRKGIHRIVPWNREDANSIRHYNVLSLSEDAKTCFLQRSHCIKMIYAGNLRHD